MEWLESLSPTLLLERGERVIFQGHNLEDEENPVT